jgi:xylulokinase
MGVAGAREGLAQSQGGTTGAFTLCWHRPLQGEMIGWSIPSPIKPELFNAGGPLTTGGAAVDWLLRSVLKLPTGYDTALSGVERIPPCGDGLLFFPYLAGEQLTMAPEARGLFLGLSLLHSADHLIRAVLEGVAFAGRSILDSLVAAGGRVDGVVTYGGQARSTLWNQIKANVWNRPVFTPRVLDAGCLGAAAIAAVGVGRHPSLDTASERMAQTGHRYLPDADQAPIYDQAYRIYRQIYPRTADLFASLSALRGDSPR